MTTITLSTNTHKNRTSLIKWCDKKFGKNSWSFDMAWPKTDWEFKFKDTRDATIFALKWM
jgi:hypothetical protein